MATEIGAYLRELRTAGHFSLSGLAERAQLAKGTLSYWEAGRFQPRLPELEAALGALGATPAQRAQALALVQAPRGVRRLRKSEHTHDIGPMPAIGDLLRALRRRAGQTPEQVATVLRVHSSTVRRWENSEVAVPPERLEDLCRALGAAPQERDALAAQRLRLEMPGPDAPLTPEAAEQQCARWIEQAQGGTVPLMELRLLCLAAQLWPQAARGGQQAPARRALARVFATHAWYLEVSGRGREVAAYADRALDLLVGHFTPERWWFDAVHAVGFTLVPNLRVGRNRRRVAYVRGWLDFTDDLYWQTSLYRDLAQYSAEDGGHNQALGWLVEAETAAERLGHPGLVRLARHIQTNTLLGLGRFEAAGDLLPRDPHPNVHQRSFEEMNWIETLLGLGERDAARGRLDSLYALVSEHGMSLEGADALARRLDAA